MTKKWAAARKKKRRVVHKRNGAVKRRLINSRTKIRHTPSILLEDRQEGKLPIIFIHKGDSPYLQYSLLQAKESNPGSEVILLGDDANAHYYPDLIRHEHIGLYMGSANRFASVYMHESPNSYDYELFCFQRWFILLDYMKARGIAKCFMLDTDVMLYTDVNNQEYAGFSFEFAWATMVGITALKLFCRMTGRSNRYPKRFQEVKAFALRNKHRSVSDMTLNHFFLENMEGYKHCWGRFHDSFFDDNLGHMIHFPPDHYEAEMISGRKKVYFYKGVFFVKETVTNRFMRVCLLHFSQHHKVFMRYFHWSYVNSLGNQAVFFDYDSMQWLPAQPEEQERMEQRFLPQ